MNLKMIYGERSSLEDGICQLVDCITLCQNDQAMMQNPNNPDKP